MSEKFLRRVSSMLRRRPCADSFAERRDLAGLKKAIELDALLLSELEDALNKAIANQRSWRALFFLTALASERTHEVFARLVPVVLKQVNDPDTWGDLETEDVLAWLQHASFRDREDLLDRISIADWTAVGNRLATLPLQMTAAWLVARFGRGRRDVQVRDACLSRLGGLTGRQRQELGKEVRSQSSRSEATIEIAMKALKYPEFVLEIVPVLFKAAPDDPSWDHLEHGEAARLVKFVKRHCPEHLVPLGKVLSTRPPPPVSQERTVREQESSLATAKSDISTRIAHQVLSLWTPVQPHASQPHLPGDLASRIRVTPDRDFPGLEAELRKVLESDEAVDAALLEELVLSLPRMPLRQSVVAAQLLARHPDSRWQQPLKLLWLHLVPLCKCAEGGVGRYEAPDVWNRLSAIVAQAAFATSEALASCVVAGRQVAYFAKDRRMCQPLREIEEHLAPLLDEYRKKVALHQQLSSNNGSAPESGYHAFQDPLGPTRPLPDSEAGSDQQMRLEREMRELEARMLPLHMQRDSLEASIEPQFSPPWLFLRVVSSTQKNATAVVQAAAGALAKLLEHHLLEEESAQQVREALQGNFESNGESGVRERVMHLMPDSTSSEVASALRLALEWMLTMEPYFPTSSRVGVSPGSGIDETAQLLCSRLPRMVQFLERYPLRLMPINEHQSAFGVYRKVGAAIESWYQYDRPQAEGGAVSRRFLRINNRMRPNAIGLDYRLLSHPLLAAPVLFHEYLHYGGTSGNEADGIDNELEVLLREIAFAKGLFADLAPSDDDGIADFEAGILAACEQSDDAIGLVFQWLENPFDDTQFALLNQEIPRIYASQANPSEDVARENDRIQYANRQITWSGWITWPLLDQDESRHLTDEFLSIRQQHAEAKHFLSIDRRDEIRNDPEVAKQLARWEAYVGREGSLANLRKACGERSGAQQWSAEEITRLMAVRFPSLLDSFGDRREEWDDILKRFLSKPDDDETAGRGNTDGD